MNFNNAGNLLEATFLHTCDVYEFKKVADGSITKNEKVQKYSGIRCQLSQNKSNPTSGGVAQSDFESDAKLLICTNVDIAPGSEVEIFTNAAAEAKTYTSTGDPFHYPTHQEIMLKRTGRA